jgi:hypothetical protein
MTETKEKQEVQEHQEPVGPIILDLKKKKKKKRRYSNGLDEIQEMERHLTRASHRMVRSVEKGIANYRLNSIKSAKKKRDGAIRDFIPNSGIAMTHALKEVGPIPNDIARAINTKPMRRRIRRQLRGLRRSLRIWRLR